MNSSPWYEEDYHPIAESVGDTRYLPDTSIEIVREVRRAPPKHVLFDFDGTLSLIREGWPEVMVPMMVRELLATGTEESPGDLQRLVYDFVMQLNGKQTIYQMVRLAEEVRRRGGEPEDPLVYKERYHELLMQRIARRRAQLADGTVDPELLMVPCAREMLEKLQRRGVGLYLASGTDETYVLEEARLLGLDRYFESRIYGARDDYKSFSKAKVIERILSENRVDGSTLLAFGDGYVEIQNAKSVGGVGVAVASDEAGRSGNPDLWKRDRLIAVGADVVVPDFRDTDVLLAYLWG